MATYSSTPSEALVRFLSDSLKIPQSYFTFPNVIFYFIIPFIAASYFYYTLLQYKLRIFRRNPIVNKILAVSISFFNVMAVTIFPPWFSVPMFIGFSILLRSGRWTLKRVALVGAVFLFLSLVYPRLMAIFA